MTREDLDAKVFVAYVAAQDIAESIDSETTKFNYRENAEHAFQAADAFIAYAASLVPK